MAAKISVKGQDMAPIYQWPTEKLNSEDSEVLELQQYLIDENGQYVAHFDRKSNHDPAITSLIEKTFHIFMK